MPTPLLLLSLAGLPGCGWGRPPPVPAACQGPVRLYDPVAPPPDDSAERAIAVVGATQGRLPLVEGPRWELLATVTHVLEQRGLPVLPLLEVAEAHTVAREQRRRVRDVGPRCSVSPSYIRILAQTHPNLVLAVVGRRCDPAVEGEDPECRLTVEFSRAGTADRTDLPPTLSHPLSIHDRELGMWQFAGARLTEHTRGDTPVAAPHTERAVMVVKGHEVPDPWLRVGPTLYQNEMDLHGCAVGETTHLDLSWTISPAGVTEAPKATVRSGEGGSAVAECVEGVLQQMAWRCTTSGEPESIEVSVCLGPVTEVTTTRVPPGDQG